MKKKLIMLLVVVCSVIGISYANAAGTFVDMSSASIQFVEPSDTDIRNTIYYDLAITGATFNSSSTYGVHFSHSKTETVTTSSSFVTASYISTNALKVDGIMYDELIEALEKAGDIYVWVKETNDGESQIIASAVKVERPTLLLNRRFATQFQYDLTSITSRYPGVNNYDGRTVSYKMGRVTDIALVKSLNTTDLNAKKTALTNLYNYAMSDSAPYREGVLDFGTSSSITRYMLDLVEGAYYYVYLEYKDSTGTYYSFDGIELYQALNCSMNPNLNDPDMPEFKWPSDDKHYCEIVDGKYYNASGNEVDEETYNKECTIPEPPHICEIVDGKYYDKNGNEVDETTYKNDCEPEELKICKIEDGKYYDQNGDEVDQETYEKECNPSDNPKCEIVDGKYYDKDGNLVDQETYETSCGTTNNPNTGVNFGLGIAFIIVIFGTGIYTFLKKKNKFPQV